MPDPLTLSPSLCAFVEAARVFAQRILNEGGIPIHEPGLEEIVRRNVAAGRLQFTTDIPAAVAVPEIATVGLASPLARLSPRQQADLTVTFHRPKLGLLTRRGAALAGRVLVAPIGIPAATRPKSTSGLRNVMLR